MTEGCLAYKHIVVCGRRWITIQLPGRTKKEERKSGTVNHKSSDETDGDKYYVNGSYPFHRHSSVYMQTTFVQHVSYVKRSSAVTKRLFDALCHLKSCQRLHSSKKNPIRKSLQWVNDLEGHSGSSELSLFD